MNQKMLESVLEDKKFMQELSKLEKPGEIKSKLSQKGINVSLDKVKNLLKLEKEIEESELDDRALELIAGGVSLPKKFEAKTAAMALALSSFVPAGAIAKLTQEQPEQNYIPTFEVKYAGDIIEHLKNFYAARSNALKNFFHKMAGKEIDALVYKTTLNRVERRLRKELAGQGEAINKMLEIMTGYFEAILEAKALGKRFEGGLVLYLYGSPATCKSTAMKIIEEEMGLRPFTVRIPDVVGSGRIKTLFTKQVKSGLPTLYSIDEIDKMRTLDATLQKRSMRNENNQIIGASMDDILRNFVDTGRLNGKNAAGSILVATSNEADEQIRQLESSFYNRYKNCKIKFNDFTARKT